MSDNLIRNPGQIKFWKGNTQMSLTFQILSWHRIYKGKTKQHQKKKKIISTKHPNRTTNFFILCKARG